MITLEDNLDPTQRIINEGAGWGAEQEHKAGKAIFYRDEKYPEHITGNLFFKEQSRV